MSRFIDQTLSPCVAGYPCISSPRWVTDITQVDSGAEQANQRWSNPLHTFRLPDAVRTQDVVDAVRNHWLVMRGPFHTWPWRDPLDFASVALVTPNVAPTISDTDQPLGTGDGVTREFQLVRRYTVGGQIYTRNIELPIVSTVVVGFVPPVSNPSYTLPSWTVSRPGGVVTFDSAVEDGTALTAGYLFDVPVRFESDDAFEGVLTTLNLAGYSDLTFIETRLC